MMDVRDGCTQILYVHYILYGYIESRTPKRSNRIRSIGKLIDDFEQKIIKIKQVYAIENKGFIL